MGRRQSWRVASDCKSDSLTAPVGSNPTLPTIRLCSSVVEQRFCKPSVIGSNPISGSMLP